MVVSTLLPTLGTLLMAAVFSLSLRHTPPGSPLDLAYLPVVDVVRVSGAVLDVMFLSSASTWLGVPEFSQSSSAAVSSQLTNPWLSLALPDFQIFSSTLLGRSTSSFIAFWGFQSRPLLP